MSSSSDKTSSLIKYTTTRWVAGGKISLTAYSSLPQNDSEQIYFIPAKKKYASISSFETRILNDAKDVACGLGMEIHSLLLVTYKKFLGSLPKELLLSERTWWVSSDLAVAFIDAPTWTGETVTSAWAHLRNFFLLVSKVFPPLG